MCHLFSVVCLGYWGGEKIYSMFLIVDIAALKIDLLSRFGYEFFCIGKGGEVFSNRNKNFYAVFIWLQSYALLLEIFIE
ncbi:hypothetical protein [Bartonella gabonensis]|uniref:hypothetical protein n=1 Tax=Bartonella gabonensis TaxID=2699889 RepID=UPI001588C967|nr:hypothetical protein [Bartonella gabonensis]